LARVLLALIERLSEQGFGELKLIKFYFEAFAAES
jgi:hypothetical protein